MCGIAGQFRFDGTSPDRVLLESMGSAIAHRGPDDHGVVVDGPVGLVSRRLAIIDLSAAGHMPMTDPSERYHIVFNGEIYNYRVLRDELVAAGVTFRSQTDTEVIVALYAREGVAMVSRLRGMFAFAIWDTQEQTLFLARDRFGKKPLKYFLDNDRLVFGSELKALLADPTIPRAVDWDAIDEFLALRYVPAPRTGFMGIAKLPPATWMLVRVDGSVETTCYWQPDFREKDTRSSETLLAELDTCLGDAVRVRLMSDVPLGAHLSGGVDSSLVVSYMADALTTPVQTFSLGFDDPRYDERQYAQMVADRFGTQHHTFIAQPQDVVNLVDALAVSYEEPYADSSALPSWLLAEQTRSHVTVALNGDGGDELFGGYRRYQGAALHALVRRWGMHRIAPVLRTVGRAAGHLSGAAAAERARRFSDALTLDPPHFFSRIVTCFSREERDRLYTHDAPARVSASRADTLVIAAYHAAAADTVLDRVYAADIATSLAGDLLPKVDIASMAHSLEVRSPFLDARLADFAFSLPDSLKTSSRDMKILLKRLARQRLPRACVDRPKQGFSVPLDRWFQNDLHAYLADVLLDPAFITLGFSRTEIMRLLLEHRSGAQRHDARLWTLLMLQRWLAHYGFLENA